jgi:hypothetical protein
MTHFPRSAVVDQRSALPGIALAIHQVPVKAADFFWFRYGGAGAEANKQIQKMKDQQVL